MRVNVGKLGGFSNTSCVAVADGTVVIVLVGNEVRAFPNRCLHQDSPLDQAWVRDGVLTCPLHFWRYRVDNGTHIGSEAVLASYSTEVVDGEVFVTIPDRRPTRSLRAELLARAVGYDRTRSFEEHQRNP